MAELYRRADESDGTARNSGKAVRSNAAPASAPGVATPFAFRQPRRWRWLPRHPTRATSAALLRLGRATRADSRGVRPLLRAPALANRPPPVARSAAPRRRSSTGCRQLAALPTLYALRHCCDTAAAARQCQRTRTPPCTPRCAGGKLPAAAAAVVPLPRCAQRSRHITYVIRSRGTAVRYAV